jgi:hypothetical protein
MSSPYDLSTMTMYRQSPLCSGCGEFTVIQPRQKLYACTACDYSVTQNEWDIISIHANQLATILKDNGIHSLLYHGVPMEVDDAVQPSHLMPHFVLTAQMLADSAGLGDSFCLGVSEIKESVGEAGNCILDIYVTLAKPEAELASSLQLMGAVAVRAVEDFKKESPNGSVMDSLFVFNYETLTA